MLKTCIFWIKVNNSTTLKNIFESNILGNKRKESIYEFGKANSHIFNHYFNDKKSFWVLAKDENDILDLIELLAIEFSTPILAYSKEKYVIFNAIGRRILVEDEYANDYFSVASIIEENSGFSFDSNKFIDDLDCDYYDECCDDDHSECCHKHIDNSSNHENDVSKIEGTQKTNDDYSNKYIETNKNIDDNNNFFSTTNTINKDSLKEKIKEELKDYESNDIYNALSNKLDIEYEIDSSNDENLFNEIENFEKINNKLDNERNNSNCSLVENDILQKDEIDEIFKEIDNSNEKLDTILIKSDEMPIQQNYENNIVNDELVNEVPLDTSVEIIEDFTKFLNEESKEDFDYEIDIDREIKGETFYLDDEFHECDIDSDDSMDLSKILNIKDDFNIDNSNVFDKSSNKKLSIKELTELDNFSKNIDLNDYSEIQISTSSNEFIESLNKSKKQNKLDDLLDANEFSNSFREINELDEDFVLKTKEKKITLDDDFNEFIINSYDNDVLNVLDFKEKMNNESRNGVNSKKIESEKFLSHFLENNKTSNDIISNDVSSSLSSLITNNKITDINRFDNSILNENLVNNDELNLNNNIDEIHKEFNDELLNNIELLDEINELVDTNNFPFNTKLTDNFTSYENEAISKLNIDNFPINSENDSVYFEPKLIEELTIDEYNDSVLLKNEKINISISNESLFEKCTPYFIDHSKKYFSIANEHIDFDTISIVNYFQNKKDYFEKIDLNDFDFKYEYNNENYLNYDDSEIEINSLDIDYSSFPTENSIILDNSVNNLNFTINDLINSENKCQEKNDDENIEIDIFENSNNNLVSDFEGLEHLEFTHIPESDYEFNSNGFDDSLYSNNHIENIEYNTIKKDIKDEYMEIQKKIEDVSSQLIKEIDAQNTTNSYENVSKNNDYMVSQNEYYGDFDTQINNLNINSNESLNNESLCSEKDEIALNIKNHKDLHSKNKQLSSELNSFLKELAREKEIINNKEDVIIKREKKLKEILETDYMKKTKNNSSGRKWVQKNN